MPHTPEDSFEDAVAAWFIERYGEKRVARQVYQPDPRWYVDLVVEVEYATLFLEVESRASEIRPGVAQALGYAAADPVGGVPMVITPPGHLSERKVDRLSRSTTVVIQEFDEEAGEFV